ncbi:hypothetical protein SAY87_018641 [Trapa incisa]|uniref:DUF6821 domain-containing protein n=1 Tax=Trapa incisa TaxID=236973 RepID=A0AAN7Q5V3_9MYRT|nr:hypothetical protein SAY87_018641 [Trapa incisa]
MDIQEWELLPFDGFLDLQGDGEVKLYSPNRNSQSKTVLDYDYFSCRPSPNSWKLSDPPGNPRVVHNQFVLPVDVQLDPRSVRDPPGPDGGEVKRITTLPADEAAIVQKIEASDMGTLAGAEDQGQAQDPAATQVSFKKTKEANEFADMKMDSPLRCGGVRGIVPPMEAFFFEEGKVDDDKMEGSYASTTRGEKGGMIKKGDDPSDGLNIWKWGLCGIGALCSIGVAAAATCCILILGSRQCKENRLKHKIRFQIYTDDKRIKQVVHHATKLNEAISAARGVPVTGAHITFGGYYEGH